MDKPVDFHAHLDECTQCRNHPFALCPVGAAALTAAVVELAAPQSEEPCSFCHATGFVGVNLCQECKGRGKL